MASLAEALRSLRLWLESALSLSDSALSACQFPSPNPSSLLVTRLDIRGISDLELEEIRVERLVLPGLTLYIPC